MPILLSLIAFITPYLTYASSLPIAGWIETVQVMELHSPIQAKLDTGADNSSLHADNIDIIYLPQGNRVRFTTQNQTLELPLERLAKVKQLNGSIDVRPVIRLSVCLGAVKTDVLFNLTDRRHRDLPILLGRSFLAERFLVDSHQKQLQPCQLLP